MLLPGYLYEPDYSQRPAAPSTLFVFLVPGSDGTCRAVREAMAAGLPVVTTKRGMLPELVGRRPGAKVAEPGGVLIEDDVELFAAAILRLVRNPEARAALTDAARRRVAEHMDEGRAAERLIAFYDHLQERAAVER